MAFWVAILLGLVQGITEFLPISSSGHLVLLEHWFGVEVDAVLLNVLLHIATLVAVVWYFRKTILYLITHPFCRMNKYLFVATIPAAVFVLVFGKFFDSTLNSLTMVAVGFILTGIFLAFAQLFSQKNPSFKPLNWTTVLSMGFAQALAIFPGLSRSGTTYSFGVVAGGEKNSVLDFSFLMSIPIIVASLVYELLFSGQALTLASTHWSSVVVAMLTAFISALLGLKLMKNLVNKIGFWWFVPYLIVVGILLLIF
ncbi:MAG: undecaprenyl-diphosphate phosphatase [Clostridia bacterium]|nr:undecaprenyl-diphosphate phosphatase [Clostridia bacterium]